MTAELLIAVGPGEWRAAWIEDGEARELYVERGDTKPPGSRHLGRVVRVVPALDAALVDIGDERPGFLPLREAPLSATVTEGAALVVEVRRDAWQVKARCASAASSPIPSAPFRAGSIRRCSFFPTPGLAAALACCAYRRDRRGSPPTIGRAAALAELRRVFP